MNKISKLETVQKELRTHIYSSWASTFFFICQCQLLKRRVLRKTMCRTQLRILHLPFNEVYKFHYLMIDAYTDELEYLWY